MTQGLREASRGLCLQPLNSCCPQLEVNRQSAETAQLKGNKPTAYACTPIAHLLLTDVFSFLSASVPIVSDLQSRIAELVGDLEQQNSTIISAQKEKARLEAVEADLSKTV